MNRKGKIVKNLKLKSKLEKYYDQNINELRQYGNGSIGAFFTNGKFRFVSNKIKKNNKENIKKKIVNLIKNFYGGGNCEAQYGNWTPYACGIKKVQGNPLNSEYLKGGIYKGGNAPFPKSFDEQPHGGNLKTTKEKYMSKTQATKLLTKYFLQNAGNASFSKSFDKQLDKKSKKNNNKGYWI
jgi:hypothetical protein